MDANIEADLALFVRRVLVLSHASFQLKCIGMRSGVEPGMINSGIMVLPSTSYYFFEYTVANWRQPKTK